MEVLDMIITFPGDNRVDASFDGKHLSTGGDGQPSPFDLFLASIGACTGAKVLAFCRERDISTDGIRLAQQMRYNPDTRMFEHIEILINLPPDFPPQYVNAVTKAAETCGVKRHLLDPPPIVVSAAIDATP